MPDKRPPAGLGSIMPGTMDPSPLTTQLVWREVASLKELFLQKIEKIEEAIKLSHDDLVRFPTEIQKQISTLKELHEEKFRSLRELVAGNKLEAGEAINKAFASAKEANADQNKSRDLAINKSETAVTKQIDGLQTLISTTAKATDDKVDALKERVDKMESARLGASESVQSGRDSGRYVLAIATFVIGALVAALGVIGLRP